VPETVRLEVDRAAGLLANVALQHPASQPPADLRVTQVLPPVAVGPLGGQQPQGGRVSLASAPLLGADLLGDLGRDRDQILVIALVIEIHQPRLSARVDRHAVELQRARRADPKPSVAHHQETDPRGGIGQPRAVDGIVELSGDMLVVETW
jgi:hypothetical protein